MTGSAVAILISYWIAQCIACVYNTQKRSALLSWHVALVAGALQTIQQMNPLAPDPEHRSAIEKGWKEGQDYFRVETAVVCHDGESIQV
jgi:hypothetical protein